MNLKAGLMPLYLEMIDQTAPHARPIFEQFIQKIAARFNKMGMKMVISPICCRQQQCKHALKRFEDAHVDAIITLHLTYSPSLESVPVLAKTHISIIVLDTTPSYSFGPEKSLGDVLYNHAIHGVQDFCNLMKRNKIKFFIEAGHWEKSDVLNRVKERVRQAKMVNSFLNIRVGLLDQPLEGMGDFKVDPALLLSKFGFEIMRSQSATIKHDASALDEALIQKEMDLDKQRFDFKNVDKHLYVHSLQVCMALRKWIEAHNLSSFSMNVFDFARGDKPYIPFLEASKQLAAGVGYAGEGDILTASLASSIMVSYPETTFTEMFCPYWENNSIFISHIGEGNYNLVQGKPKLIVKKYPLADFKEVVVAVGGLKPGKACLVNIAPGAEDRFDLLIIEGEMLPIDKTDNLNATIHGWFRPERKLNEVIAEYSKQGGTHHVILVYGEVSLAMIGFAELMGWKTHVL